MGQLPGNNAIKPTVPRRLAALDLLRGTVMFLMVLDHAWYYFSQDRFSPLHPWYVFPLPATGTYLAAFFTAWVPRFCAPVFVLIAGISAYLYGRMRSRRELCAFLLTRGLWLLLLEFTVLHWVVNFTFSYTVVVPLIFWILGCALIVLAALIWLPNWAITTVGVAILAGHNLLDGRVAAADLAEPFRTLWVILYEQGSLHLGGTLVIDGEPLLPWLGLICLGYGLGALYQLPPERRIRWLTWLGIGGCLAFVALRWTTLAPEFAVQPPDVAPALLPDHHGYGDPRGWYWFRESWAISAVSFVHCTQAPASLLFMLLWLGPAFLVGAAWEWVTIRHPQPGFLQRFVLTLGRVPLFFFLLQWLVLHLLAVGLGLLTDRQVAWLFNSFDAEVSRPSGWEKACGYPFPVVYAMWLVAVAVCYPFCAWFAGVKERSRAWWLQYL